MIQINCAEGEISPANGVKFHTCAGDHGNLWRMITESYGRQIFRGAGERKAEGETDVKKIPEAVIRYSKRKSWDLGCGLLAELCLEGCGDSGLLA